ncbi:MAG: hypothetical protein AB3N33_00465 [Puniceicoccaceae bacterium]
MKYFAAVGAMQGNGPRLDLARGEWSLGFEVGNIPHLSAEKRTVGFNGTKEEDLNKSPLLARPMIHYGLFDKLSLTASYVPPIEVFNGLKTHLAGLSANYQLLHGDRITWTVRLIGQWSEAKGDFTAPSEIVGDPDLEKNPFEAIAPSRDTYTSWTGSIDSTLYYKVNPPKPIYVFLSLTYTYGDFEFDVLVPQPENNFHTNNLTTDGGFWMYGGGLYIETTERTDVRFLMSYAPLDVRRPADYLVENDSLLNFRVVFNYRL